MKLSSEKLSLAMATACLDANELCQKAGIGPATFTQAKNGRRNAKPKTIGKLAKALGVPVTDLIQQEG